MYLYSMALYHALEMADFERSNQVKILRSMLPNAFDKRSQVSDCASVGLRRLRRRRKFVRRPPWFMISGSDLSLIARRFATCRPVPAIIFGDFIRYMIRDISTSGAVPDFLARFTAFIFFRPPQRGVCYAHVSVLKRHF